jgi:hypothetical protein
MITGCHVILPKNAEADKTFVKNVLKFKYVDINQGWLIFKLPPSELAVHPSDEQRWGRVTRIKLPGGGTLGLYQARHERP